jgi:hypothetical protein
VTLYLWNNQLLIRTIAGTTGLANSQACCCGQEGCVYTALYLKITVVGASVPTPCDGEYYFTLMPDPGPDFIYTSTSIIDIPGAACGICGTTFYVRCLEGGNSWDWYGYMYTGIFTKTSATPLLLEDGHPTFGLSGFCGVDGIWLFLSVSDVPW